VHSHIALSVSLLFSLSFTAACNEQAENERRLVSAIVPLCRDLPRVLSQPGLTTMKEADAGRAIGQALESHRLRVAELAESYEELPAPRRLAVQTLISKQCQSELKSFYGLLGDLTRGFETKRPEAFQELLREVVIPWQQSESLWAFEFFSPEAVEEVEEMAGTEKSKPSSLNSSRRKIWRFR
jgi:hypothetical protein